MSKLTTMLREAEHFKPKLFETVLVWSAAYLDWRLARYDGGGIFTVEVEGKRKSVPRVRWWIPLPKLPKKEEECSSG